MAYYYHDPSGLGVWWVPDGQTPAQALQSQVIDNGGTVSPILAYSVANTPDAQKVGGGNPSPATVASPPQPTGYTQQGASIVPVLKPLTKYQIDNSRVAKITTFPGNGSPGHTNTDCDPGYFYDAFSNTCVPVIIGIPFPEPGGGTNVSSTPGVVNIQVNNAVNLAQGVGQAIGDDIQKSIEGAIDQTNQAVKDTTDTIKSALGDVTSGIGKVVDGIIQNVYKAITWLGNLVINNISKVVDLIRGNIGDLVSGTLKFINKIDDFITNTIKPTLDTVNNVISNTIAPIFNTIQQVYQQTAAAIDAIKNDLSHGLTGILQLPQDVTNSITSIEATIQRTVDTIGLKKKDGSSVFLDPTGQDSIWNRLQTIGHGVNILGNVDATKITYADMVRLSEPDLARAGAANINALVGEITDFAKSIFSGTASISDAFKTALPLGLPLLGAEVGTWIGAWELFRAIEELFEPFYEFAKDDIKARAGLSKLPVGQVLEAYRRGIVTDKDLAEDLAINGWDSGRIQVLKDLQEFLVGIEPSIDMWHRGIVTEEELDNSLRKHGVSGDQMAALKEQSVKLFSVQLAATALRWKLIDEQALDAVLRENRYSDTEITAFKATLYQPEDINDTINRERLTIMYAGLGYTPQGFADISSDALEAANRSGLSSRTALDRWQASFYVLPLSEWIVGYFRNLFTLRELVAAFDYYRVPDQWRDTLVNIHRSLVPWRTIPTMLANGIIDEPYAKQQLQAHGFDLVATEALLKYAGIATQKKKVASSGDLHALSVQTARHYFEAGTLSEEQYRSVLVEHGYDPASADLTIQVETQHAVALQRKQSQADIANEVLAGTITLDQAISQMDAARFSPAEKARVANTIQRTRRQQNKIPSEADLHSMAKAGAISTDQYSEALQQDGWPEIWITAFVKWRFPHAAPSAATA